MPSRCSGVCVCAVAFFSSVAHHNVHTGPSVFFGVFHSPFFFLLSRCLIDYLLNASAAAVAAAESMLHFLALPAMSIS